MNESERRNTRARPGPCASCPYRVGVPSGIWDADEYAKLLRYDGELAAQDPTAFQCHQNDGSLCAGWVAHTGDPLDLLAVRLNIVSGRIDPDVANYTTAVELFDSGAAAAAHGMSEIHDPGVRARVTIDKILKARGTPE